MSFKRCRPVPPKYHTGHYRAREKIHDVNFWMRSFLKSVGTLIAEDGEDVLPTQMQPVAFEDFDSYLKDYVGDTAILSLLLVSLKNLFKYGTSTFGTGESSLFYRIMTGRWPQSPLTLI